MKFKQKGFTQHLVFEVIRGGRIYAKRSKLGAGFTVAELLIAIVMMGFIIPAIALGLTNLTVINQHARDTALANMIAQNKIETLRSIGYNGLNNGATTFTSELPSTFGSPKSASYTVSTPQTGLKQIDVSISYTEYQASRSAAYRSYIGELGVGQ